MGDFFSSNRFKLMVAIAAALVVLLMAGVAFPSVGGMVTAGLNVVLTPLQRMSASIAGGADGVFSHFEDVDALQERVAELEEQVAAYQQQLADYEETKKLNEQYKTLLQIKGRNRDWEVEPATVIGKDPNERFHSFTIDKGSMDGISVGDPVISESESRLVGVISDVGMTSSKVITIADPSLNIGATDSRTGDTGIVTGSVELAEEGRTKLTLIRRESGIAAGDVIRTSGIGGSFPSELLIGTVVEARPESSGISLYAVLEPSVDLTSVRNVFVIRDFPGKGAGLVDGMQESDLIQPIGGFDSSESNPDEADEGGQTR